MHTVSRFSNEKQKAVGDMALIAFYYLLRVGEYTLSGIATTTLTQAFSWDNTTILDHSLPLDTLLRRCTAATLCISNQKNGKRNHAIHHEAQPCDICPTKALVHQIKHIHGHKSNPNKIISTCFIRGSRTGKVTHGQVHVRFRYQLCTQSRGNKIRHETARVPGGTNQLVQPPSRRRNGAPLKQRPHTHGLKMGFWISNRFLDYIHEQIAVFSAGLSTAMGKIYFFITSVS
jgi:hypothetical protein